MELRPFKNDISTIIKQKKGIFNAGTDKIISRYQFAKMIADEWKLNSQSY